MANGDVGDGQRRDGHRPHAAPARPRTAIAGPRSRPRDRRARPWASCCPPADRAAAAAGRAVEAVLGAGLPGRASPGRRRVRPGRARRDARPPGRRPGPGCSPTRGRPGWPARATPARSRWPGRAARVLRRRRRVAARESCAPQVSSTRRAAAGSEIASCGISRAVRRSARARGSPAGTRVDLHRAAALAHGHGPFLHLPGRSGAKHCWTASGCSTSPIPRRPERRLGHGPPRGPSRPDRIRGSPAGFSVVGKWLVLPARLVKHVPTGCSGCWSTIRTSKLPPRGQPASTVSLPLPTPVGQGRDVRLWSRRALRRNWHERRVPFALAVGAGLV